MPHVTIDTGLIDSDESVEFGELLGDPDAWRHLVRLWGWGIQTDKEDGIIKLPAWKIAEVCGYRGDADELFAALTAPLGRGQVPWLMPQGDGSYYMRGWSRNGRYFKEKQRLRDVAQRRRCARDQRQNGHAGDTRAARDTSREGDAGDTRDLTGNPSPSPSPSPSLKDNTASPPPGWSGGINTVEELEGFVANNGWRAQLRMSERKQAKALLDTEPITATCVQDALEAVKAKQPERVVAYFLGVVEGQRKDADKPRARGSPKPSHEDHNNQIAKDFAG